MADWGNADWGLFDWGVATTPANNDAPTLWNILVNWTGTFQNEAQYVTGYSRKRGTPYLISPNGEQFDKIQTGEVNLTLENRLVDESNPSLGRRYNPYNTNSPIYDGLHPGVEVIISVTDLATQVTDTLFTGTIADIRPVENLEHIATMRVVDGITFLQQQKEINVNPKEFIHVHDAIAETLKAAQWPKGTNLKPSGCIVQIFDPTKANAMDTVDELCQAGLGRFFIDRLGRAAYYDLSYDGMTTYTIDQTVVKKEIPIAMPWDNIRNDITIWANRRGVRPFAKIAASYSADLLDPSQTQDTIGPGGRKIVKELDYDLTYEPSRDVGLIQILANESPDGKGQYANSGYIHCALSNITSTKVHVHITSTWPVTVYIVSLLIGGKKYATDKRSTHKIDSVSIKRYLLRMFAMDSEWLQDFGYSQAYASILLAKLKDMLKDPIITYRGRPTEQFKFDLYDKVAFSSTTIGVSDTYRVGCIEEKWNDHKGLDVETKLYLQSYIYNNPSVNPIASDLYYPGVDPFPEVPIGNDPGGGTDPSLPPAPPPSTDNTCLSLDAPANGPYSLKFDPTSFAPGDTAYAPFRCYLRKVSDLNPSYLKLDLDAEFSSANISIVALDASGNIAATGSVSDSGDGHIAVTFDNAADVLIAGFKIQNKNIPASGNVWLNQSEGKVAGCGYGQHAIIYPSPDWYNGATALGQPQVGIAHLCTAHNSAAIGTLRSYRVVTGDPTYTFVEIGVNHGITRYLLIFWRQHADTNYGFDYVTIENWIVASVYPTFTVGGHREGAWAGAWSYEMTQVIDMAPSLDGGPTNGIDSAQILSIPIFYGTPPTPNYIAIISSTAYNVCGA